MVEKIIENVINEMSQHLSQEQLEHLSNVLYVNFHGCEIQETCTDLTATGIDGDEAKIRMFVASKRAVNRQIKTLKHYTREIYQVKEFLGHEKLDTFHFAGRAGGPDRTYALERGIHHGGRL